MISLINMELQGGIYKLQEISKALLKTLNIRLFIWAFIG